MKTCLIPVLTALIFAGAARGALDSGLVGYWPFDEGSGQTFDDMSGSDLTGNVETAEWVDGKFGSALDYNGSTYSIVPHKPVLNDFPNGMTISAWLYRSGDRGGLSMFISREIGSTSGEYFGLGFQDNEYMVIMGNGGFTWVHQTRAPNQQWIHYVWVYDNANYALWVDGVRLFDGTHGAGFNMVDNNPLHLGGNSNTGGPPHQEFFYGRIDDLRIYNRPLSGAEIGDLYDGGGIVGVKKRPGYLRPTLHRDIASAAPPVSSFFLTNGRIIDGGLPGSGGLYLGRVPAGEGTGAGKTAPRIRY